VEIDTSKNYDINELQDVILSQYQEISRFFNEEKTRSLHFYVKKDIVGTQIKENEDVLFVFRSTQDLTMVECKIDKINCFLSKLF